MSIVILGDVHLGRSLAIGRPGIGSALNSKIVDQINILDWTLNTAIGFLAHTIIITGDIFHDTKPHPTLIALFIAWLKKCTDNNVDVHIVVGNHDVMRSGHNYISTLDIISAADIEGVHVYKTISTLSTPGASFTLIPFRDRRSFNVDSNKEALHKMWTKLTYELAGVDLSHAKIAIGHLAIEGSIPVGDEIDDATNEIFCPVDMFKGYDFTWMGHIHKPQIMSKAPFVAHIGSMDLSDFSESDHQKTIIVFDPNKSEPYRHVEIPTRPLNQLSISVPSDISDTTQFVVNKISDFDNLAKSIVRVNVSLNNPDSAPIDRTIVEKRLYDLGTFHISRINEERKISLVKKNSNENIDSTVNEKTAIKMFAETNIDEDIRSDFINVANDIVKEFSAEDKA